MVLNRSVRAEVRAATERKGNDQNCNVRAEQRSDRGSASLAQLGMLTVEQGDGLPRSGVAWQGFMKVKDSLGTPSHGNVRGSAVKVYDGCGLSGVGCVAFRIVMVARRTVGSRLRDEAVWQVEGRRRLVESGNGAVMHGEGRVVMRAAGVSDRVAMCWLCEEVLRGATASRGMALNCTCGGGSRIATGCTGQAWGSNVMVQCRAVVCGQCAVVSCKGEAVESDALVLNSNGRRGLGKGERRVVRVMRSEAACRLRCAPLGRGIAMRTMVRAAHGTGTLSAGIGRACLVRAQAGDVLPRKVKAENCEAMQR